jgi:two-component system, OmpR family, phosphate regulon sensor histidine kinase PhoR
MWLWLVLAAAAGAGLATWWNDGRGQRVSRWLSERPDEDPPVHAGRWGDVAQRAQRVSRERRRLLDAERLRLRQFVDAIEASPNGVTMIGSNDAIEWCNATAADHFYLDPEGDRLQRITNLVRSPAFYDALARGETDEPVVFEDARHERRLSILVRRYGEGMRLVLSRDVTQVERHDTMRRHFVANVSHEIRTPLTVLASALDSLRDLPLDDTERLRVVDMMREQTDRMQQLVADLLMLARLEGSPRPAVDAWMSLDSLWPAFETEARALSAGRHQLRFEIEPALEVAGVEGELRSLVSNLVGNAIRYTPESGRVEVRFERLADGSACLTVTDTGIGIAAEHIPHITERFYRVDGSRSRATGGTGLGLSIVKHIVQRHGAELTIDSRVGVGSTFRVRFPLARVRADARAAA